jgi:hypothetical protein
MFPLRCTIEYQMDGAEKSIVYGFSSLMKQNKKAKNYAVFCFAGKRIFFFIYLRCDYMGKIKKKPCYLLLRKPVSA